MEMNTKEDAIGVRNRISRSYERFSNEKAAKFFLNIYQNFIYQYEGGLNLDGYN